MNDPVEVWIAMDDSGEHEAAPDESTAIDRLKERTGAELIRLVRLKVSMTPPSTIELDIAVQDEAGHKINVAVE